MDLDFKILPNSYVGEIKMPGFKSGDVKVHLKDERYLIISGEEEREAKKNVKYDLRRPKFVKFLNIYMLPKNSDMNKISAVYENGLLTVTVEKLPPPPENKRKRKSIVVQVA